MTNMRYGHSFSMSGRFLCLSMWKAKVEHTLLFHSWPNKIVASLVGNNGIFLACSSALAVQCLLVWECSNWLSAATCLPQNAHPPQSPSLSWHITATLYTNNVRPIGKQDFVVWLLFKESIYRNDTHSIFLEHGISRCFNNDTLLCKYWCATMGSTVCSCK